MCQFHRYHPIAGVFTYHANSIPMWYSSDVLDHIIIFQKQQMQLFLANSTIK